MKEYKEIYYEEVKPLLKKNKAKDKTRKIAFQIVEKRQKGMPLTDNQDNVDKFLLTIGINTFHYVPLNLRRDWRDQPD